MRWVRSGRWDNEVGTVREVGQLGGYSQGGGALSGCVDVFVFHEREVRGCSQWAVNWV